MTTQTEIKTVLIEGVGWPEIGKIPKRFKHAYVKPVRVFKNSREKGKATDEKFDEWIKKRGK